MKSFAGLILTLCYGCFCLAAGIASNLIAEPASHGPAERVASASVTEEVPAFILPSPQGLLQELSIHEAPNQAPVKKPVVQPSLAIPAPQESQIQGHEPTLQEILAGRMWSEQAELQDTVESAPASSFVGPIARIAVQ